MTVADDLATLHPGYGCLPACAICAARRRVEAGIARLERELDEVRKAGWRVIQAREATETELRDGLREVWEAAEALTNPDLVTTGTTSEHIAGVRMTRAVENARALAEGGVASENVCPCGHHADQHPAVWSIAGDATTRCQAEGCRCLDYDGPDLGAPEDGAADFSKCNCGAGPSGVHSRWCRLAEDGAGEGMATGDLDADLQAQGFDPFGSDGAA